MLDMHELDGFQPIPLETVNAFIGNAEKKCLIQLLVLPGEEVNARVLNQRFAEAQEPEGFVTYKSSNNLPQIISDSHCSAGTFVAPDSLRYSRWKAVKATESELVDSLAGHNLALSRDYGLSLEEYWGKSSTNSKSGLRSPEIRIKMFEGLSSLEAGQHISIRELASRIGCKPSTIHKHIQKLNTFGFVEYAASEIGQQKAVFEIIGNPDPTKSSLTMRGKRIRSTLHYRGGLSERAKLGYKLMEHLENGETSFSYDDIVSNPDDEFSSGLQLRTAQLFVGVMLREGILKRHHKTTLTVDQFSEIFLDEVQKEIIDRTARFYRGLRDGQQDIIQEGLELGTVIIKDKKLVAELLERGFSHSPNTSKISFEQRALAIGSILAGNVMSTRELQIQYDEGRLTIDSIGDILRKLRASGKVTSRKIGNEQHWQMNSGTD